jgi:hypothetical protein
MSETTFLTSYFSFVAATLFIAWKTKHNFLEITIFNVFLFFALLLNFTGIPIVYYDLDAYQSQFITDKSILITVYIFTTITLFLTFFTYILTSKYIKNILPIRFKPAAWNKETDNAASLKIGVLAFSAGIGGLLAYGFEIGFSNLPLFVSFTDGSTAASIARSKFGAELKNLRWYQLFMNDLLLIGSLIISNSLYHLKLHKANFYLITITIVFSVAVIYVTGGIKANFAFVLLAFYLAKTLNEEGVISFRLLILPALFGFASLIIGYYLFMGVNVPSEAIRAIFSRVTTAQIETAYHHISYVQQTGSHLMGQTFPNPMGLFPFEPINFTRELVVWVHGENPEGIVGSYPSFFWAELYVNFGFVGIFFGGLIVGFYLGLLDYVFKPNDKSPIKIAMFVWLILHFKDFAVTSFSQFIFDTHFLIVFGLFILTNYLLQNNGNLCAKPKL